MGEDVLLYMETDFVVVATVEVEFVVEGAVERGTGPDFWSRCKLVQEDSVVDVGGHALRRRWIFSDRHQIEQAGEQNWVRCRWSGQAGTAMTLTRHHPHRLWTVNVPEA